MRLLLSTVGWPCQLHAFLVIDTPDSSALIRLWPRYILLVAYVYIYKCVYIVSLNLKYKVPLSDKHSCFGQTGISRLDSARYEIPKARVSKRDQI